MRDQADRPLDFLGEFLHRLEIPREKLAAVTAAAAREFASAEPFPHVVLDGLFDPLVMKQVVDAFPGKDAIDWERFDTPHEQKLATKDESQIPLVPRLLIQYLNSAAFLNFVEEITGITGLIADPHLSGGGLHQIAPGGKLGIHTDFLRQQRLKLDRRLNLILYLNDEWKEEYGGHLELWSRDRSSCVKRVMPLVNRVVIFNTTGFSYHGHPDPLQCPPDRTRKSVAIYYYTNGRPADEMGGVKPTLFMLRPGERAKWKLRQILRKLIPPIVFEMRYRFKK